MKIYLKINSPKPFLYVDVESSCGRLYWISGNKIYPPTDTFDIPEDTIDDPSVSENVNRRMLIKYSAIIVKSIDNILSSTKILKNLK